MPSQKRHKATPTHSFASDDVAPMADVLVDTSEAESAAHMLEAEIEREYDVDSPDTRGLVEEVENALELTGASQDEMVDAIEQIRENTELDARGAPRTCPTCHRPFVVATMNRDGEETKSSKIRRLAAAGMSKGDIGRELGITYQFVHNVLSRPVGKTG